MDNILDIVYDYSIRGKMLDEPAVDRIIEIAKNLEHLSNVSEVEREFSIPYGKNYTLASFSDDTKSVILYPFALFKHFYTGGYKSSLKLENELNPFERILRKNLHMVFIIFHELEHAYQYKNRKKNNIEMELANLEITYIEDMSDRDDGFCVMPAKNKISEKIKRSKICSRNYSISFIERMANTNAIIKVQEMIKDLDSDKLEELYDSLLLSLYMSTYIDEYDSPTKRFFREIKRNHRFANIIGKYEPSYEDRLKYGLNLTSDEYQTNIELIKSKRM